MVDNDRVGGDHDGRLPTTCEGHWDDAYLRHGSTGVSWFQPVTTISSELLRVAAVPRDAAILDVGGGTSNLVDALLGDGFSDLTVLDISGVALAALRDRLGPGSPVTLVHADLLSWTPSRHFDLWHDRAVLHFLVEAEDRLRYLSVLRSALQPGGTVIVGTFAADGPEHCSGLPVARYSSEALMAVLGDDFEVLAERREEHVTPGSVIQPFTWVAARLLD